MQRQAEDDATLALRGDSAGSSERMHMESPVKQSHDEALSIHGQMGRETPRKPSQSPSDGDTSPRRRASTLKRRNSQQRRDSDDSEATHRYILPPLDIDPDFAADASALRRPDAAFDLEDQYTHRTASRSHPSEPDDGTRSGRADSTPHTPWGLLWSCVRRCCMNSQPPGFYDLNDPVRRKQAEREQMTELTVSFFESSWVFLLLIGTLASFTAWSVDGAVLLLIALREKFTDLGGAWLPDYLLYTTYRVFILLLGVTCTYFVCPNAAGSGIPEMRSILGGFPFPNYLRMRTLFAKAFGLIFALGSGLSIGKEGPFVHLSCVIAHQLLRVPLFRQIRRSQDLTHHVLAAACAVGVTATFGTPIGGVLFSIEVTTTYYVTSNYWRAFFSSVVGVVVFRQLNSLLSGNNVSLFTTEFAVLPYEPYEMVFFLTLAAVCGILAALFVRIYRFVFDLKAAFLEHYVFSHCSAARSFAPFVYATVVALTFSLIEFPVGSFMLLSQREVIDDMFSERNLTMSESTHLEEDYGNSWESPSLALNLMAYVLVRFFSTVISATVMVPSGIVTPVFAIGAAFGRLFGEMIVFLGGGNELAGGYAVVGAASFTAGITGTISIAVIVFELTSQLSYMIPVLLCVLVGRSVALFFSLDMYETIGRQKNLPQWPDLTKQKSYGLIASDLMRGLPTYWVKRHQTLASLRRVLEATPHDVSVFPIVDDVKTMIYLGVADRDELESIVEQWELCLQGVPSSISPAKRDSLSGFAFPTPEGQGMTAQEFQDEADAMHESPLTPGARHAIMSHQLALAGVSRAQGIAFSAPSSASTTPVDLVALGLLSLDTGNFHVHRDTFASHVILLISVHKSPQLFVTARGRLIGVIHAADLLARTRRFTL
ncbi:hypothetical protein Poli38472_000067 [Pythium oligandrum]|uniref:Chloride channel protein n=1 Tax=Pythium oligandrum TaxID=41045 RepID=A0A8K1CBE9_PYTOL|nr:hypothetical protein Poli38472_000067 [Pythium oligandrum]|eukprot:TMW60025.1 hypothetical protein Poli38472_000067 [Pythium oligandrum]